MLQQEKETKAVRIGGPIIQYILCILLSAVFSLVLFVVCLLSFFLTPKMIVRCISRSMLLLRPAYCLCAQRVNYSNGEKGKEVIPEPESLDEPVKYSESEAHLKWKVSDAIIVFRFFALIILFSKARHNFEYTEEEMNKHPPSTRLVAKISIGAMILYFCYLREENDIDERLYQPLWKTVPELEIPLFESAIIEHRRGNRPTSDLEAHLKKAYEKREREMAEKEMQKSTSNTEKTTE